MYQRAASDSAKQTPCLVSLGSCDVRFFFIRVMLPVLEQLTPLGRHSERSSERYTTNLAQRALSADEEEFVLTVALFLWPLFMYLMDVF